jgi:hypothetical protein
MVPPSRDPLREGEGVHREDRQEREGIPQTVERLSLFPHLEASPPTAPLAKSIAGGTLDAARACDEDRR